MKCRWGKAEEEAGFLIKIQNKVYIWELSFAESKTVAVLGVILHEADSRGTLRSAAQAWPSFTKWGPAESSRGRDG